MHAVRFSLRQAFEKHLHRGQTILSSLCTECQAKGTDLSDDTTHFCGNPARADSAPFCPEYLTSNQHGALRDFCSVRPGRYAVTDSCQSRKSRSQSQFCTQRAAMSTLLSGTTSYNCEVVWRSYAIAAQLPRAVMHADKLRPHSNRSRKAMPSSMLEAIRAASGDAAASMRCEPSSSLS